MSRDILRTEGNERVDLSDFQFQSGEGQVGIAEQVPGQFLTDSLLQRQYILDGFAVDNPSGSQIRVTRGRAILSRREGGVVSHALVSSEGDAEKIIDVTAFTATMHGIYIRFEYVDGDPASRVFWDANTAAEFSQNINTRRKANWSMRIEQTNPGAEWFKIAEVDLGTGPGAITDERDFYFEGVAPSFATSWGGGADRDSNRAANGIKDLGTFVSAIRTLFEELRPAGALWVDRRGVDVTGFTTDEAGVTGRGQPGGDASGVIGHAVGTGDGVLGFGTPDPSSSGVEGRGAAAAGAGPGTRGVAGAGSDGVGGEGVGNGTGPGGNFIGGATGAGVTGEGGSVSGTGVVGTGNGGGANGVEGFADTTGYGVRGVASLSPGSTGVRGEWDGATRGHGGAFIGDPTSPLDSSIHIGPQDLAASSSPEQGDGYVNSVTGALEVHDGTTFRRQLGQASAITAASGLVGASTTAEVLISDANIPAGTLRAGTGFHLYGFGVFTLGAAGNLTLFIRVSLAGSNLTGPDYLNLAATVFSSSGAGRFVVDFHFTAYAAPSASTSVAGGGMVGISQVASPVERAAPGSSVQALNTSSALDVEISAQFSVSDAGNQIQANQLQLVRT